MRALLLALAMSAVAALPALAKPFETPKALITAVYSYDTAQTKADAPSLYSPFFSDDLNARLQADLDSAPGEPGSIDFDPVIAGNDGTPTKVKVGKAAVTGDKALVDVSFQNGGPVTLHYSLVREHGGWKVDDIAGQTNEFPWRVRALLDSAAQ